MIDIGAPLLNGGSFYVSAVLDNRKSSKAQTWRAETPSFSKARRIDYWSIFYVFFSQPTKNNKSRTKSNTFLNKSKSATFTIKIHNFCRKKYTQLAPYFFGSVYNPFYEGLLFAHFSTTSCIQKRNNKLAALPYISSTLISLRKCLDFSRLFTCCKSFGEQSQQLKA